MKQYLTLLFCLVFCTLSEAADYHKTGHMSYKHMSGMTYEITIVTYAAPNAQKDLDRLPVNFGDGSGIADALRTSLAVVSTVEQQTYKITHTYANSGTYLISIQDQYRDNQILNINGGASGNIDFYLEAQVIVPTAGGFINNSATMLNVPIFSGIVGQAFSFKANMYDEDGDVLLYELITPKESRSSSVPYQDVTLVLPGAINLYTFNAKTGHFVWDAPQLAGKYVLSMKVSECRNNQIVGYTIIDFQIEITSGTLNQQFSHNGGNLELIVSPNDSVIIDMTYEDNEANAVLLSLISETFLNGGTATEQMLSSTINQIEKRFVWVPTASDVRCAAYELTFKGTSSKTIGNWTVYEKQLPVSIIVQDTTQLNCDGYCTATSVNVNRVEAEALSLEAFPNPFKSQTIIKFVNPKGNEVYSLQLFDLWGREIQAFYDILDTEIFLERGNLVPGVYIYKVTTKSGQLGSGKLMLVD